MIAQSWRETITEKFIPHITRLTLVADPESLITEEGILDILRGRGFEILQFDDPVEFRYAYESLYRIRWDNGETVELIVVIEDEAHKLQTLPYDLLLQSGRQLSFSLSDLFPNLNYQVVKGIERSELDVLYQAQQKYSPERMGEHATEDFVLKHIFEIEPVNIREPAALLHVLLRRFYRSQHMPVMLEQRFLQLLRQNNQFQEWSSLEQIVGNKEAFLQFLQERWPIFLNQIATGKGENVHEQGSTAGLIYPDPVNIPFGHDDVRAYIDTLFLDGMLHPVTLPLPQVQKLTAEKRWEIVGIENNSEKSRVERLERLLQSIEKDLPTSDARHQQWQSFSLRWAELLVRWHERQTETAVGLEPQFAALQARLDRAFQTWVLQRYHSLYNLPAISPIMLHQIPNVLSQQMERPSRNKIALIVIDGMAFDQWIVLKEVLVQQRHISLSEEAIFAWVPTITAVSRQSIFAGKLPLYYADSIYTTQKEETYWRQFWMDKGFNKSEIAYKKGINADEQFGDLEKIVSHPKARIVGLVVDKIDKITHGMQLGTAGMHNQVHQWARQGFMARLLDMLAKYHFTIYITSDHGNIEAKGCGRPMEGAVAEERGERVRVYNDQLLRQQVQNRYLDALAWPATGLPKDYLPLLAPDREAFVSKGETIVGHGGITIEELLIPYIHVRSIQQ